MRVPSRRQSYFRYPLSRILASEGAVRVLRELIGHAGETAIPRLAEATKLNHQTVRNVLLGDLAAAGIVEMVGQGRSTLYRARATHPLYSLLAQLFAAEDARVELTVQTLAGAARATVPGVLAVWMFGSVARGDDHPGSDLDVALVVPQETSETALADYRERVSSALDSELVPVSVVGLSVDDVLRLDAEDAPWWRNVVADAQPVLGLPPAALAEHLRSNQAPGGGWAA